MAPISSSLEHLALSKLDHIGSRLTSSRREILEILESSSKPLTVTDVESKSNVLVQSSLYRNLSVLVEAGLVTRIINEHDFAFFELDEHVLGHHHHLRCRKCGNVSDIEMSKEIEALLESTSKTIAKKYSYSNVEHHLDFSGICSNCKS